MAYRISNYLLDFIMESSWLSPVISDLWSYEEKVCQEKCIIRRCLLLWQSQLARPSTTLQFRRPLDDFAQLQSAAAVAAEQDVGKTWGRIWGDAGKNANICIIYRPLVVAVAAAPCPTFSFASGVN
jgi:hypothetical protein